MKTLNIIVLSIIILTGCVTEKAAQRQIKRLMKHQPQLFQSDTTWIKRTDTINVFVPSFIHDTIVKKSDTITIETERFTTTIQTIRDSIFLINTQIKEMPVPVVVHDSIPIIQKQVITKTVTKENVPWWMWVVVGFVDLLHDFIN